MMRRCGPIPNVLRKLRWVFDAHFTTACIYANSPDFPHSKQESFAFRRQWRARGFGIIDRTFLGILQARREW
jgi:hypothetical protein